MEKVDCFSVGSNRFWLNQVKCNVTDFFVGGFYCYFCMFNVVFIRLPNPLYFDKNGIGFFQTQ